MDILDFFWTFYLNHLSPLWGFFLLDRLGDQSARTPHSKDVTRLTAFYHFIFDYFLKTLSGVPSLATTDDNKDVRTVAAFYNDI